MKSWDDLPWEMQEIIIKQLNRKERNVLRSCSSNCQNAVAATKSRSITCLTFGKEVGNSRKWFIEEASRYGWHVDRKQELKSFEEFQKKLIKTLKAAHSIKYLKIQSLSQKLVQLLDDNARNFNKKNESKLFKRKTKVKNYYIQVERIKISECASIQIMNLLSQMEPGHLKKVEIVSEVFRKLYDMPQISMAESVAITGRAKINEEQLLNLNACEVSLCDISCSVRQYFKRCALQAATRMPRFKFTASSFSAIGLLDVNTEAPNNKVQLNTPHPQLKFELEFGKVKNTNDVFVKGGVRYESESSSSEFSRQLGYSSYRVIEMLGVSQDEADNRKITVRRRFYGDIEHNFKNHGEFQENLDEIIEHADFIKYFKIDVERFQKKLVWKPRKVKLIVDKLRVRGNNSISCVEELLQQIDPNFPMSVRVELNEEKKNNMVLFDMQQVRNAHTVVIENPFLSDEKLMEMKAVYMDCRGENVQKNRAITEEGINDFIKKCRDNLGSKNLSYNLGEVPKKLDKADMVEGLEVIRYRKKNDEEEWVIKTNDPEYVMVLKVDCYRELSLSIKTKAYC